MNLFIAKDGTVRCLYGEAIDLAALGAMSIRRASRVEPDDRGRWWVDLRPCGSTAVLGPYKLRGLALEAEALTMDTLLAIGAIR